MATRWTPSEDLSPRELSLLKDLKRTGKLFGFLRQQRHALFDEEMQQKLEAIHAPAPRGTEPVPAAQLVMAMLLQAYTRCSDDEAVRRCKMDLAWKMVLGTLDQDEPPFSKTTLVDARKLLIQQQLDLVVLRRTVELAAGSKLFDPKKLKKLRIALDSAPLEGWGRVEDTLNLLGSALGVVLSTLAVSLMVPFSQIVTEAHLHLLAAPSIKSGMDLDWSAPDALERGLQQMLGEIQRAQAWIESHSQEWILRDGVVLRAQQQLFRIVLQDVEILDDGTARIRQGVTPDRQISIADPEIRHGRKTRCERIDGYKRYDAVDLETGAELEACCLPANVPEARGADKMMPVLESYGQVCEVHVDRAFLSSQLVQHVCDLAEGRVVCRPFTSAPNGRYGKHLFGIDLEARTVTCPAGHVVPIRGEKAHFPVATCAACSQRPRCQKADAKQGRSVALHPREALLQTLRAKQATAEGRAELRERTTVEHALARTCNRQGPRARYAGVRKNDFDARRHAAVNNLFLAARQFSEVA